MEKTFGADLPNMIEVDQSSVAEKIQKFFPEYMPMGTTGIWMPHQMKGPANVLPMEFSGSHSMIQMSGMFIVVKVRESITHYNDPGWYKQPPGTAVGIFKTEEASWTTSKKLEKR